MGKDGMPVRTTWYFDWKIDLERIRRGMQGALKNRVGASLLAIDAKDGREKNEEVEVMLNLKGVPVRMHFEPTTLGAALYCDATEERNEEVHDELVDFGNAVARELGGSMDEDAYWDKLAKYQTPVPTPRRN
jgi:hypothetical protein